MRFLYFSLVIGLLVGCGREMRDVAPAAELSSDRFGEAPTQWVRVANAREIAQCAPSSTELPHGLVVLTCDIDGRGIPVACQGDQNDQRLNEWAICAASHFRASPSQAGKPSVLRLRLQAAGQ